MTSQGDTLVHFKIKLGWSQCALTTTIFHRHLPHCHSHPNMLRTQSRVITSSKENKASTLVLPPQEVYLHPYGTITCVDKPRNALSRFSPPKKQGPAKILRAGHIILSTTRLPLTTVSH